MQHSPDKEPMKGFLEYQGRRSTAKAEKVRAVVHALSDRFTGEPFPAMSDHYTEPTPSDIPGQIGSVAIHLNRWDDMGADLPDMPIVERPDSAQLPQTAHGWRLGEWEATYE